MTFFAVHRKEVKHRLRNDRMMQSNRILTDKSVSIKWLILTLVRNPSIRSSDRIHSIDRNRAGIEIDSVIIHAHFLSAVIVNVRIPADYKVQSCKVIFLKSCGIIVTVGSKTVFSALFKIILESILSKNTGICLSDTVNSDTFRTIINNVNLVIQRTLFNGQRSGNKRNMIVTLICLAACPENIVACTGCIALLISAFDC